jgi:hypothetical protein
MVLLVLRARKMFSRGMSGVLGAEVLRNWWSVFSDRIKTLTQALSPGERGTLGLTSRAVDVSRAENRRIATFRLGVSRSCLIQGWMYQAWSRKVLCLQGLWRMGVSLIPARGTMKTYIKTNPLGGVIENPLGTCLAWTYVKPNRRKSGRKE